MALLWALPWWPCSSIYLWGWAQTPPWGNSILPLGSAPPYFWSLPKAHDCRWGLKHRLTSKLRALPRLRSFCDRLIQRLHYSWCHINLPVHLTLCFPSICDTRPRDTVHKTPLLGTATHPQPRKSNPLSSDREPWPQTWAPLPFGTVRIPFLHFYCKKLWMVP